MCRCLNVTLHIPSSSAAIITQAALVSDVSTLAQLLLTRLALSALSNSKSALTAGITSAFILDHSLNRVTNCQFEKRGEKGLEHALTH